MKFITASKAADENEKLADSYDKVNDKADNSDNKPDVSDITDNIDIPDTDENNGGKKSLKDDLIDSAKGFKKSLRIADKCLSEY